jgi:hypothetical protein
MIAFYSTLLLSLIVVGGAGDVALVRDVSVVFCHVCRTYRIFRGLSSSSRMCQGLVEQKGV